MRPAEFEIREGDALGVLRSLPQNRAQTCVTSPPYFGLRDYGHADQLGHEDTPGEYVARLVEIMREVRRVLRPDGTLWLNLGDSYNNRTKVRPSSHQPSMNGFTDDQWRDRAAAGGVRMSIRSDGLKEKDLFGIPWRVAFALQDDGWWLRKAIVWNKPNPIPEAVRDRPTSSHEMVFLLAPAATYFYDVDGVREPSTSERPAGNGYARDGRTGQHGQGFQRGDDDHRWQLAETRQLRDVWTIPTVPFPAAHFAVFPPELPRRCILLGSSPRACEECGAPWRRVVRRRRLLDGEPVAGSWVRPDAERGGGHRIRANGIGHGRFETERHEVGWRPGCACGAPPGVEPGDLDEIETPLGELLGDPSLEVGRSGLARPRDFDSGVRILTRWEQRHLARQLAGSPHREAMEAEAGPETFAHYLRTDPAGARPPRPALLEAWRERGWVNDVEAPPAWWDEDDAGRCLVLDPFAGAGTTGLVAVDEGRDFLGVELNPEYTGLARERVRQRLAAPRFEFL